MTAARICPVCGSSNDSRVYAPDNFDPAKFNAYSFASRKLPEYMHARLIECPDCDLVYANPLLDLGSLENAYAEAAFDSGREAAYAAQTYARLVQKLLPRLPDRQGALDIGTGDGIFLRELLNLGFTDVIGVEPSHAPVAAAAADLRLLIREEMFDPSAFAPNSLSLVTCFQTIEHVLEPRKLCEQVFTLLKPGGALLLVGHNRRAWTAKLLGKKSPIFDIEHLQLFSPDSMTKMLQIAGYSAIEHAAVVNRYPLNYWLRLFPLPMLIKQPLIKSLDFLLIGKLPIPMSVGNVAIWGQRQ